MTKNVSTLLRQMKTVGLHYQLSSRSYFRAILNACTFHHFIIYILIYFHLFYNYDFNLHFADKYIIALVELVEISLHYQQVHWFS